MKYYRNLYIDYSKNYMMALELDNENILECLTEEDVNKCCTNSNASSNITVNGITFKKNQVISVYFGNLWNLDYIPIRFCYYFSNLTHLDPLPNSITSIDKYFMSGCTSFNQPITIPESVTSIDSGFMQRCNNFTGPLKIMFNDMTRFTKSEVAYGSPSLTVVSSSAKAYTSGIDITGSLTGVQVRSYFSNLYGTNWGAGGTTLHYRKINN